MDHYINDMCIIFMSTNITKHWSIISHQDPNFLIKVSVVIVFKSQLHEIMIKWEIIFPVKFINIKFKIKKQ